MTGNFIGPMPPRDFLKEFMQMDDFEPAPEVDFTSVPYEGLERGMYQELCDAINDSGVCPGYTLADVSNRVDENGIEIRPDWALCRGTRIKDKLDFSNMEFPGEGKASKIADAFFDTEESDKTLNPLEKVTGQSASTRGQLISYTATLHSFQHRCFSFSFLICGQYARLFRWDRSGCVVTALFNFHDEPELLAAFFWCYAHLSLEEQGYDTTVKRATPEEAKYLADAVDKFIVDSLPRDVSFMLPEENPAHPYPVCKIRVEMKDGPHNLIVKMPFLDSADSACGRATRAYTAFDMKERRLVFFKDSWRTEDEDYASEAEIYEELAKRGVPFLPIVLAAGDVTNKGSGETQITFTQVWSDSVDKPEWRLPCDRLRKLIHHRVVQELAYPLNTAQCSKEAVQAILDVLQALKVAYHAADYHHRDVSTGNVMIDRNGRGILNDWDHAVKVLRHGKGHAYRTGTWQFISIALLRNPVKSHDILDDMESCFWALLYVSLIHFELEKGDPKFGIFNEYSEEKGVSGEYYTLGGTGKTSLLTNGEISRYEWKSAPLNKLLRSLGRTLHKLNNLRGEVREEEPHAAEELKALEDRLRTVDPFIQLFDEALAMDSWVDDRRANPVDKTNKKQAEQKRLEAKTASYRTIQEQASAAQLTKPKTLPAGPSHLSSVLASGSSHSSTKRRADEVSENVQVEERRKFVKRARTEMPPREDPEQPPQAVGEHRYQTRSKTKSKSKSNGSKNSKSAPKKSLQDVSMQDVNHSYGLRSRTKAKANPPPPPPPPPPKTRARGSKKAAKEPAPKQSEKQAQTNKKQRRQNKRGPRR